MILIVGGAFQGKLDYACRLTGYRKEDFLDGRACLEQEIFGAKGICYFHEYIKNRMKEGRNCLDLAEQLLMKNPDLVIVTNELGYGIVPLEPFDRSWRETVGRVCTGLAKGADRVDRVVCGLGAVLKLRPFWKTADRIQLWLIRHGETEGNLKKRYIGITDEPLCPEGIRRLEERKEAGFYGSREPDAWFLSPMRRCRETAEVLGWNRQSQTYTVEDFRECDFGLFENKNYQELADCPMYQQWVDSKGILPFPEGENPEAFRRRSCLAFEGVVDQAVEAGWKQVKLVVHGGTIMSIMERFASPPGDYFQWQVENGDGYVIYLEPEEWKKSLRMKEYHRLRDTGSAER